MPRNISPKDIHVQHVAFHRNGIIGESFHAIRFIFPKHPGKEQERLIGILFTTPKHVAVMSQDKFEFDMARYDGAEFEQALRVVAEEWQT